MATMNGPKGYVVKLDDDIVQAAREASNRKIDDFARLLSADFEPPTTVPPAWEIEEFQTIYRRDRE